MQLKTKLAIGVAVALPTVAVIATTGVLTLTGESYSAYVETPTASLAHTPHAVLPGSGLDNAEALNVSVPGVLEAKNLFALTTGAGEVGNASAEAISSAEDVDILNGVVKASAVLAMSSSGVSGTTTYRNSDGSTFSDLVVNGTTIDAGVAPNTRIDVPGVGTVVLNEQLPEGDGFNSTGLTVNMIHVLLKDDVTGATTGEIIVGSARSVVQQ